MFPGIVAGIPEISIALIYGSYASNAMRPSSDVDVLIVAAKPEIEEVFMARIAALEKGFAREINYSYYLLTEFREKLAKKGSLSR